MKLLIQKLLREAINQYGYRAGDLINKPETLKNFYSGGRGTGHFGTGFYFFGTEEQAKGYSTKNGKDRPISKVDFSKYNLLKVNGRNGGFHLHDTLKEWENFNIRHVRYIIFQKAESEFISKINSDREFRGGIIKELIGKLEPLIKFKRGEDDFLRWTNDDYSDLLEVYLKGEYFDNYEKEMKYSYDFNFSLNKFMDDFTKNYKSELLKNDKDYYKGLMYEELKSRLGKLAEAVEYAGGAANIDVMFKTLMKSLRRDPMLRMGTHAHSNKTTIGTELIKSLGYDGIDVRGIPELDNAGYGSIIYDIK